jgi:hypothetical protein
LHKSQNLDRPGANTNAFMAQTKPVAWRMEADSLAAGHLPFAIPLSAVVFLLALGF